MKSKLRNNRHAQAPKTQILVAKGNQGVKTSGDLNTGGNAVNLSDGQLGFMSENYSFLSAATTAAQEGTVLMVQGTENSGNLSNVSTFGINAPAYQKSAKIYADEVISVCTDVYSVPTLSMQYLDTFKTIEEGEQYNALVNLESRRRDIEYSKQKRDQRTVNTVAKDFVTAARNLDYVLHDLAIKLNTQSELCGGTRPFMVLGIDSGGNSGGVALGGIAKGDLITICTIAGISYVYTATTEFVASLSKAIDDDASLATAKIVNLSLTNAGADAVTNQVDALLVVGLNEQEAVAYDDNFEYKVTATMGGNVLADSVSSLKAAFISRPVDDQLSGKFLKRYWEKEVSPYIFDLTYVSHPYDLNSNTAGLNPFDASQVYTRTVIEFWGITPENGSRLAQSVEIYLPAAISDDTADASTGYTIATTATTTKTQLNASIGAWLESASDAYNKIEYKNSASKATPFV